MTGPVAYDVGPLPRLVSTVKLGRNDSLQLYDAKFYPYTAPGVDPVFALCGGVHTVVCRPSKAPADGVEVIRWFRDQDSNANLNSLVWSVDPDTGDPLLCVSGCSPKITVLNIKTGQVVRILVGHGRNINDMAVSPSSPQLLATASEDNTVRIWHLAERYKKQPTAVILASHHHREKILSIAFHSSGRYLLAGDMGTCISLWALPNLPNDSTGSDHPPILHYPHFCTTQIHSEVVDRVEFFGDLILSKCAKEHRIVLWRIHGFSSNAPVPDADTCLPATQCNPDTRSAFGTGWQQLLAFDAGHCEGYYIRFSLLHVPLKSPVLMIGNEKGRVLFWDLQSIENGVVGSYRRRKASNPLAPGLTKKLDHTPKISGQVFGISQPTEEQDQSLSVFGGPFKKQKPHLSIEGPKGFMTYQCAWNVDGEWCVASGSNGTVLVFRQSE